MKISDLKTTLLSIPFIKKTQWPYGTWDGMTVALVQIITDEGLVGYGESLCEQQPATAIEQVINSMKPLLIGEDPFNTERIFRKMEGYGGWHMMRQYIGWAFGGIDMALWDIIGKACNQPLYRLLGGKIRDKAEFFRFIPHDEPENMAIDAKDAVQKGYSTIYCKYTTIEHLRDTIPAIRETVGFEPKLWIDFNQTISAGFAVQFLSEMEKYKIDIVEQPVLATDIEGMAYVRNSISGRLLSHESSWTLQEAANVIKNNAADIISVEPRMTWGIMNTKKAAGMAEAVGMPALIHSSAEMGLAMAAFLHIIVSTPNMILPNQGMYDWYADDYIEGGKMQYDGPCLRVPEGDGLGVTPDFDKVEKYHEEYLKMGPYHPYQGSFDDKINVPLFPAY